VLLVRPETYMNRSGWALRCLADRHELAPADLLVVFDDVALPLGRLRARPRGSAGGHRGLESILESLQTGEVPRLRLGVGPADGAPPPGDLAEFVLGPFEPGELAAAEELVLRAGEAARLWLAEGLEAVMTRFNRPEPAPPAADGPGEPPESR
jgi:PTH1 family peptidyl-tRNA hydrolase